MARCCVFSHSFDHVHSFPKGKKPGPFSFKATQDYLNEIAEKSRLFKKIKESHDAYMKEVLFYTQIAENCYDNYLLSKTRKG